MADQAAEAVPDRGALTVDPHRGLRPPAAWRHCEQVLTPQRMRIRQVARALLVYPRYLPYQVAAAIAGGA